MAFTRPGNYPFPKGIADPKTKDYLEQLYRSLIDKDRGGEFFIDRAPSADLRALIVRPEWYGAKADGVTDDTTAMQAAADSLTNGGMCVLRPGKTYYITGTIYLDNDDVWFGAIGGKATLKTTDAGFPFAVMVHGGTITAANRTLSYYNSTYSVSDYNGSRRNRVTVENIALTRTAGYDRSGFGFEWADDCSIINCSSEYTAGNGFNFRFTRRAKMKKCSSLNPQWYNVFCWMSSHATIEDCYFEGGVKGIELKQRYDSEPCHHRVLNNVFKNIDGSDIGGGLGLLDSETNDYFIDHYEIVEGCLIQGNKFLRDAGESYPPLVTVGVCAEQWKVIGNEFDGGGISTTYAMQVGSSGTFLPGVKEGTPGGNHLVAGNSFYNMSLNRVLDIGTSCSVVDNLVSCTARMFAYESSVRTSDALNIDVRGNTIRGALLGVGGQGILATFSGNTESLSIVGNIVDLAPTVNVANATATVVYSTADRTLVIGNYINISQGPDEHTTTYGVQISGSGTANIDGNHIAVDGSSVKRAIYIDSSATDDLTAVSNNTIENLGTTTGATGVYASKRIGFSFNKYVGTWNANFVLTGKDSEISASTTGLAVTNTGGESKELLTLKQTGAWGAALYQSIKWRDNTNVVGGVGMNYDSGTGTCDWVFHSAYNGGYKAESDVVAKLSATGVFTIDTLLLSSTGSKYVRTDADDQFVKIAGAASETEGACLQLFGGTHATQPGNAFQIYGHDDSAIAGAKYEIGYRDNTSYKTVATFDAESACAQYTGSTPSAGVTNGYKQYSADIVAGNAAPHFRTEAGDVVKLYKYVDADFANTPNSGDTDTDDLIDKMRDALIAHGLIAST